MRISSKTTYAIKTLTDLALYGSKGTTQVGEIARRQRIPKKFLEQILLTLKGAGMVASRRGKDGGYLLVAPPSEITLASVLKLTEGNAPDKRPAGVVGGQDSTDSLLEEIWTDIRSSIDSRLQAVCIQDICSRLSEFPGGANHYVI